MTSRQLVAARLVGLCLIAACANGAASAATEATKRAPVQNDCKRMPHGDARQNCLSEASSARAATRSTAAGEDPATLSRNALRRCEALSGADREDCAARMQGGGTRSGSVAGGGIYRELVTREAAAAASAASASRP